MKSLKPITQTDLLMYTQEEIDELYRQAGMKPPKRLSLEKIREILERKGTKMSYPQDHFQEPLRSEKKRGAVAVVETTAYRYIIWEKGGRVWIEASGWGGKQQRMPQVSSVGEAKEVLYNNYTKPLPPSEKINF